MLPRIRDVARAAGVSTATVSYVLNGTRQVKTVTRERVLQAVEELGYRPNEAARSLRTRSTRTVALVIPNISHHFFGAIAVNIEEWLRPQGYTLIVCNTMSDTEHERHILATLIERRVNGVIFAPAAGDVQILQDLRRFQIPVVLIDRDIPGAEAPCVQTDNLQAARLAVDHLAEDGHRHVVVVVEPKSLASSAVQTRLAAFQKRAQARGLTADQIELNGIPQDGAVLRSQPAGTAFFPVNYQALIHTMSALNANRLRFPDDVGLLSFDDSEWAGLTVPPLSCIRQPVGAIADKAAQLIYQAIDGQLCRDAYIYPAELVIRASCSCTCREWWTARP